jgi:hypothetical protein
VALGKHAFASKDDAGRYEDVIGRVLAAALAGDGRARSVLIKMGSASWIDGHGDEVWHSAVALYQVYARTTGKLPPLPGV